MSSTVKDTVVVKLAADDTTKLVLVVQSVQQDLDTKPGFSTTKNISKIAVPFSAVILLFVSH